MYVVFTVLIVVICVFTILIVLVQNSKGGGLASNFSSSCWSSTAASPRPPGASLLRGCRNDPSPYGC